ncbi:MAG: TIGR04283 family arsenosugar biosynthesis glycosyltransferase [Nitrospirota bacterium]|nr:TIGR04283 family arsenosugar biosynthesis glycosyltransferase [Nitrospirota bacterium]
MALSIAVIIPTLNEEHTVSRVLLALQSFQFHEIFIVDGGSEDRTSELVQSHLQDTSHGHTEVLLGGRGRARQMNAGASRANADVLLFLHADTLLPSTALSDIENAMNQHDCVGGRFDVQFQPDRGWAWVISRFMNSRSRLSRISTGDQAIFVRRTVFQELGGYADIPLMEDIELSYRLKQRGPIAAVRSKVTTSFRRWEQHGALRTILHMWGLRFLFWIGIRPERLQHYYAANR